ncbi:UNVERIFIED_CONTAM: hypothetical protein FKN15_042997 [Acipenser sinensis]
MLVIVFGSGVNAVVVHYGVTFEVGTGGISNETLDFINLHSNKVDEPYPEPEESPTVVYTITDLRNYIAEALSKEAIIGNATLAVDPDSIQLANGKGPYRTDFEQDPVPVQDFVQDPVPAQDFEQDPVPVQDFVQDPVPAQDFEQDPVPVQDFVQDPVPAQDFEQDPVPAQDSEQDPIPEQDFEQDPVPKQDPMGILQDSVGSCRILKDPVKISTRVSTVISNFCCNHAQHPIYSRHRCDGVKTN